VKGFLGTLALAATHEIDVVAGCYANLVLCLQANKGLINPVDDVLPCARMATAAPLFQATSYMKSVQHSNPAQALILTRLASMGAFTGTVSIRLPLYT
jgi:hypothetical protein